MFDLTKFLKGFSSGTQWNRKIKKYIKDTGKITEFNQGRGFYSCNTETAIGFIKSIEKLDEVLSIKILNELFERRVLELKSELVNVPISTNNQSNTLESDHFNIYGVSNIGELSENIIEDIRKSKPENIKDVFKDYVYFFTYFYKYNSIRTHVSAIRKAIKASDLPDEKKEIGVAEFKFSDRVHDWLNEGGKKKRVKNMTEVLSPIEVPFLKGFMNKARKHLKTDVNKKNKKLVFTYLAVAVSISIARRLSDIVSHSEVSKVDEYKVKITGMAKKRDKVGSDVSEIIVPTLFFSADEVLIAIDKIKRMIPATLRTIESRDKHAHNLADFKLVDKRLWVQGSKFDSTRAIGAIVMEQLYNQNNIIEENRKPQATYIQQVLGHGSDDFTTYQHYYKRQVLLKSFEIDSYLSEARTAML